MAGAMNQRFVLAAQCDGRDESGEHHADCGYCRSGSRRLAHSFQPRLAPCVRTGLVVNRHPADARHWTEKAAECCMRLLLVSPHNRSLDGLRRRNNGSTCCGRHSGGQVQHHGDRDLGDHLALANGKPDCELSMFGQWRSHATAFLPPVATDSLRITLTGGDGSPPFPPDANALVPQQRTYRSPKPSSLSSQACKRTV